MMAGIAALGDQAHVESSVAHNDEWLPRLTEAFTKLGLEIVPSVANFILIRFPKEKGRDADAADEFLSARGIVHRKVASYGLPDCLRMTIGSGEANERTIAALTEFMGKR
jgi:histidinol-phosphate aminotransferase